MDATTAATAADLKERLDALYAERALAEAHGLAGQPAYIADLELEIEASRNAYVGAAVTEIATFRAELGGPLAG